MTEKLSKDDQLVLYTWFELEASLRGYLHKKLDHLPDWAIKRGYTSLEELHQVYKDRLIYEFDIVKKMGFLGYFLIVADMINYCRQEGIPTGPGRGSASGALIGFLLKITKVDPIRYNLLFERFLNPDRASMPDVDIDVSQHYRYMVKDYFTKKYGTNKVASIGTFSRMKVRAAIKDIVRSLNLGGSISDSFRLADKISKTLEEEDADIDFDQAMKIPAFKEYMDNYPIIAHHLRKCEDVLRQTSMHAAGVLISAAPLEEELPLMVGKNGMVVTAYDGKTIDSQGYLKLDTLGLKNLDIIVDARKMIKKLYGAVPEMEIDGIEIQPNEDPSIVERRIETHPSEPVKLASRAFKSLRENSTLGIFQCEQIVTQDLLRRGNVNSIEDIADILALIRPGPRKAGSTDIYISRKRKEEEISYIYEAEFLPGEVVYKLENFEPEDREQYKRDLIAFLERQLDEGKLADSNERRLYGTGEGEDFLDSAHKFCSWIAKLKDENFHSFNVELIRDICHHTQGLPLYQEQLMQISVRCAGFTKGQSDNLRKAVGKKDRKLIKQMGDMFIEGLVRGKAELNPNGIDSETAKFIWYKFVLPYGSYGFNCIDGDQMIVTDQGLISMKEVATNYSKYRVLTFNGKVSHYQQVSFGSLMGEKEILEVKLTNGTKIRATSDHRFLSNGEWHSLAKIISKRLGFDSSKERLMVESVESLGIREVYDIEVPETHNFVLENGAIAHNCSHAISYGLVSYETAWLKANFPGPFYASLLTHESDQEQINKIIFEAKNAGIIFLPPNVNQSTNEFALLDDSTIVLSLTYMKGLGDAAVVKIVQNRPYKNMVDFIGRSEVNQSIGKVLVKAGAFDNAFEDEKISRKNYFDFYDDCKKRLDRHSGRLLREQLIKRFGFVKPTKEDKTKQETSTKFHQRMMIENPEYKQIYDEERKKEIESFIYDWNNPITFNNKGAAIPASRSSEDDREEWTMEEMLEFEEKIFGTVVSAHRLDSYRNEERNFIKNAKAHAVTIFDLSRDPRSYPANQLGYIFCQGVRMAAEFPYKSDKSQMVRLYEFETRANKITATVFDKLYQDYLKKDPLNSLVIMRKKQMYKPILIIKCRMNDYRGMRTITLEEVCKWINQDEILAKIKTAKQQELLTSD